MRGHATLFVLVLIGLGLILFGVRGLRPVSGAAPGALAAVGGNPEGPSLAPVSAPPPEAPEALLAVPSDRAALARALPDRSHMSFATPEARLDTTLDIELTRALWKVLDRGRVALGHVVVLDPRSGRVLAYLSTDPERFPPGRLYPAASLIKVVTAAAALDRTPDLEGETCRYVGSPYRLTPKRVDPPRGGRSVSMRRALAQSNNQCFAQLAVHRIGSHALLDAIDRFGLLVPPAPGHAAGTVSDPGEDAYALGQLGSGLDGTRITPLHAAQMASVLFDGVLRESHWAVRATDASGRELALPARRPDERVLTEGLAQELRQMMVETTRRGTARRAFRTRRGRPLLQGIDVAGKTGSLSGDDPKGRYEWFLGVAPADAPRIAVATVAVQGDLYWISASQLAAEVFKVLLCPKGVCREEALGRWDPPRFAALGAGSGE